jgi:hypothetical protein
MYELFWHFGILACEFIETEYDMQGSSAHFVASVLNGIGKRGFNTEVTEFTENISGSGFSHQTTEWLSLDIFRQATRKMGRGLLT